ncbi:MAG: 1-acyl-sn-glycerol-3-phosphate acyltransferase [Synechococcaceae cyanobacterium]
MPAAAPLEFLPPLLDRRLLGLAPPLLRLALRRGSNIRSLTVRDGERLVAAMADFQAGRSRLLLAFRHPSVDDPLCMAQLLWRELPQLARRQGVRLRSPLHAQFLYDRGIPLWAGQPTAWLLRHLGGCSIQRGKLDLPALRCARELLLNGPFPFAVAPEGATNGHNERISPLEPGVAQLAFWTADDLQTAGRPEATTVLPIGIQYSFPSLPWAALTALLAQLEREAGLDPVDSPLLDRLLRLSERYLTILEQFYSQAYPQRPAPTTPGPSASPAADSAVDAADAAAGASASIPTSDPIIERLERLRERSLRVVEDNLGLSSNGDLNGRCRRVEQAGWDRLFPAAPSRKAPPPCLLERGLADRLAEETERLMWHMRMVESFVAVSGRYVRDCPSPERLADLLLLLWDTSCRIQGRDPSRRPRLGPRHVCLSIADPIAIQPLLSDYRADRRAAVAHLTSSLQQRLEACIQPTCP